MSVLLQADQRPPSHGQQYTSCKVRILRYGSISSGLHYQLAHALRCIEHGHVPNVR